MTVVVCIRVRSHASTTETKQNIKPGKSVKPSQLNQVSKSVKKSARGFDPPTIRLLAQHSNHQGYLWPQRHQYIYCISHLSSKQRSLIISQKRKSHPQEIDLLSLCVLTHVQSPLIGYMGIIQNGTLFPSFDQVPW